VEVRRDDQVYFFSKATNIVEEQGESLLSFVKRIDQPCQFVLSCSKTYEFRLGLALKSLGFPFDDHSHPCIDKAERLSSIKVILRKGKVLEIGMRK
jgi:hypothetical protein